MAQVPVAEGIFTFPSDEPQLIGGAAALAVSGSRAVVDTDDVALKVYLYGRAQSVMGGTSQIQKNIIATRILGLPAS